MTRAFRLLDVFTVGDERFTGNPLCVIEDARGLADVEMQALARQFNLSETTFVLPPTREGATARVRIFTPTLEMPFAGHPTLGTAHVVRDLLGAGDRVVLEMRAGLVPVTARADDWTLRTARPAAEAPARSPTATRAELAAMLGLDARALVDEPLWLDTGAEQLVVPLASLADVERVRPDAALLARHGFSEKAGESMVYAWSTAGDPERIVARFFFMANGAVVEDPATGSACANLGGWMHRHRRAPGAWSVSQGAAAGRPSLLSLRVAEDGAIFVGGRVREVARGRLS